jgi:hypothetical protein
VSILPRHDIQSRLVQAKICFTLHRCISLITTVLKSLNNLPQDIVAYSFYNLPGNEIHSLGIAFQKTKEGLRVFIAFGGVFCSALLFGEIEVACTLKCHGYFRFGFAKFFLVTKNYRVDKNYFIPPKEIWGKSQKFFGPPKEFFFFVLM